jgi:phosphoribosylformimino-5-aminoimidazole carboxamide ribotide isomerase
MGGEVVLGAGGNREQYRPIRSGLCPSSTPLDMVRAYLGLYPFTTLYIADLDAIRGRGSHLQTVQQLRDVFPDVEIWLDAGISSLEQWQPWQNLDLCCVVGSESQRDLQTTLALLSETRNAILSLDFMPNPACDQLYDPVGLLAYPQLWPERIIIMTLAKVGSNAGPDLHALGNVQQRLSAQRLYAAGGVRNKDDLLALRHNGAAGALVASALHNAGITGADLREL